MPDIITEALLEMYFFRAMVEHFRTIYGGNFLRLLKPSNQQEAWIGFDQGWVHSTLSTKELLGELQQAIQSQEDVVDYFYLGYFLQFKKVERMTQRSKYMPAAYDPPYLRSRLSLKPNRRTGLSQHETLLRLSNISYTSVCYACGMLFTLDDIYEDPDLDRLVCVDISSSPKGWATNQDHFITFQNEADRSALWCSEPTPGMAFGFREWAFPHSDIAPRKLSAKQILNLIEEASKISAGVHEGKAPSRWHNSREVTRFLPQSFTILQFGKLPRKPEAELLRAIDL